MKAAPRGADVALVVTFPLGVVGLLRTEAALIGGSVAEVIALRVMSSLAAEDLLGKCEQCGAPLIPGYPGSICPACDPAST
ncbi:DNA polymerase II [Nitratidesulfovibrio vulgaris]|uniref:DNA polymerase II n=1 Tax=Nitratidesulfovibrio vulgaris TaxID=881 RepID=UPI0023005CE1|nr:DNA polymerase II [Nitratidesulfovibrio vulgaris]WCB45246.1 DNA polymerase II [Nitratidesulfovibrio vulgaris]